VANGAFKLGLASHLGVCREELPGRRKARLNLPILHFHRQPLKGFGPRTLEWAASLMLGDEFSSISERRAPARLKIRFCVFHRLLQSLNEFNSGLSSTIDSSVN
jgi:hypothetical protein